MILGAQKNIKNSQSLPINTIFCLSITLKITRDNSQSHRDRHPVAFLCYEWLEKLQKGKYVFLYKETKEYGW